MNTITIYIPRILNGTTVDCLRERFHVVGKIDRVDFVPIGKKQGFTEILYQQTISAFVHFEVLFIEGVRIKKIIDTTGSYKFVFGNHSLHPAYYIFLPATNPIPPTMMNKAQIVENCRFLEKKVEDLTEMVEQLTKNIAKLHEQNVVYDKIFYELISGLYNNGEQKGTVNKHFKLLGLLSPSRQYDSGNTSKWEYLPTTRQGDENERRIEILEKQIQKMTTTICYEDAELQDEQLLQRKHYNWQMTKAEEFNDSDNSISTHSSMPELIPIISDEESYYDSDTEFYYESDEEHIPN